MSSAAVFLYVIFVVAGQPEIRDGWHPLEMPSAEACRAAVDRTTKAAMAASDAGVVWVGCTDSAEEAYRLVEAWNG